MSDLIENVQDAIFKAYDFNGIATEKMSRAAIAAVAEWLDEHQYYPEKLIAGILREQLEQPK